MKFKRIFLVIIDSVGVGALPDAHKFNDENSHTLNSVLKAKPNLNIPDLRSLGIGNLKTVLSGYQVKDPIASYGRLAEISNGKDTLTGHYELMGLKVTEPFMTFTETGFPDELIKELEKETGEKFIGNIAASGTEIIKELGEQQLKTKEFIIYTSADSVLQLAANEDIIPLTRLYEVCEIARKITLKEEWKVARVIARPFTGSTKETFKRTMNRHDYALRPFAKTVLNSLEENKLASISVGKIKDIFDGYGITESHKAGTNDEGMDITIKLTEKDFRGLAFTNLVDFDALYGHRRDPLGYAKCLEEFDKKLEILLNKISSDDLLIVTADHGNDPSHKGTDHTREYVPLLVYNPKLAAVNFNDRDTFADVGATIADNFDLKKPTIGTSFLNELKFKK